MRQFILLLAFLLLTYRVSASDTLRLYDDKFRSTLVIAVPDYEAALRTHLGQRADHYIHYVDSLAADPGELLLQMDYAASLRFYYRDDYIGLHHALMDAFRSKKAVPERSGNLYTIDNVVIREQKTRVCGRRFGAVTGVNWLIKDSVHGKNLLCLRKSNTRHAFRIVNCF